MKIKEFKLEKNDAYLLFIFLLVSISIFFKVYFNHTGYLSNDSTNYLLAAQSFLNGDYFYVFYEFGNSGEKRFFSAWPIGYPFIISALSYLFNCSVFLASKIANIIFILGCIIIFRINFKLTSSIIALFFLSSSYLELYSYSWSETGFIFFLLLFSINLYYFLFLEDNLKYLLLIIISSICLFLLRYIGLFTIGILIFFIIYSLLFSLPKIKIKILFFLTLLNILFVLLYFYYNYRQTGLISGIPRGLAPETNFELLKILCLKLISEITIPVYHSKLKFLIPLFFIQLSLVYIFFGNSIINVYYFLKKNCINLFLLFFVKNIFVKKYNVIGFIGLSYLGCIILIRWIFYFNEYSFRLLGPGTFLIYIWLVTFLHDRCSQKDFRKFSILMVILSLISFTLYVPLKTYLRFEQTYNETIKEVKNYYKNVEDYSILIHEKNKHMKYLRPKIQTKKPSNNEDYNSFINRIKSNENTNIYIDLSEEEFNSGIFQSYFVLENYDKSIFKVLEIKH